MEAVFAAAQTHGKFLELNANPARLDLNDIHLAAARDRGIPLVINSDARSTDGLNVLRYGIIQARRGGLTKEHVANTRPWKEVKEMLGEKWLLRSQLWRPFIEFAPMKLHRTQSFRRESRKESVVICPW
jgi:hypothetical protein